MEIFRKNSNKVFELSEEIKANIEGNLKQCIDIVCDLHGITKTDFFSSSRKLTIIQSRHMVVYYMNANYKSVISAEGMSHIIGLTGNHATVLHAIKSIDRSLESNKDCKQKWDSLCELLQPINLNNLEKWIENEEFINRSDDYFALFLNRVKNTEFSVGDFKLFCRDNHFSKPVDNVAYSHYLNRCLKKELIKVIGRNGAIKIYQKQ